MRHIEQTRTQHEACVYASQRLMRAKQQVEEDEETMRVVFSMLTNVLRDDFDPLPCDDMLAHELMKLQQKKQWTSGQATKLTRKAKRLQNEIHKIIAK